MAKKRRVKSKHTGVLEEGIGTGRGKRSKVTPPTRLSEFGGTSQSPAPSASPAVSAPPSASTSQRPTRSGGIGAGPSSARGAPSRRKRPRYTEHDASDDSSDSSSEEDDEDEEMGSSDEEKDAAEEAQSDADAEGEPDEELIAAANGDVKGKGKAVMPEPSPAVRGKSRAAPPPKRKVSPAEPASEKKQPRGVSASASPKKTGTPAPTTKRAAAAAAARAAQEAAASEEKEAARKAAEEAESRSPARGGSTTAAGRGRRSTATADAAPAATANQQADANEDVEVPSASKAANGRGGSRRPTKVVFNAVPDDVAEQPVPDPSKAPDSTSKEPTPRRGARGRQSAAKKADEAEPVNGAGTEKETPAPTRRSGRASNARATQVDVEEPASEDVPPDERDDVGPSRGTRGAARAARASLGAEVSAAAALGSAPELESRTDGEETAASPATRGARGGRGGARGGRGGRGGRARGASARGRGTAAGSSRGRSRGSRASGAASEEMQRGGASFAPADVEAEDPNAAEDDAPPASLMLDSPPRSKEHRAAHVYSLPRPTHVGQGGPAGAGTSAAADAGLSRPHGSPSPASSRFLYPDASNPYGSSPYPAYPHQAQTPVTTHHHPTRPQAGVYHSEPGLARTAFYYFGVSPISRPYIHPGHAVPDDLLENGDEASVFGSDFATTAMGDARLPGSSGLAAYRLSSPVARAGFNPPALSAEGLRGPRQSSPPRLPGVATKRVASKVSAVRGQAAPGIGLGDSATAAGPPPALQEEARPEWSGLARRPSDLFRMLSFASLSDYSVIDDVLDCLQPSCSRRQRTVLSRLRPQWSSRVALLSPVSRSAPVSRHHVFASHILSVRHHLPFHDRLCRLSCFLYGPGAGPCDLALSFFLSAPYLVLSPFEVQAWSLSRSLYGGICSHTCQRGECFQPLSGIFEKSASDRLSEIRSPLRTRSRSLCPLCPRKGAAHGLLRSLQQRNKRRCAAASPAEERGEPPQCSSAKSTSHIG